jgi:Polymer-forming cytoskeletal
MALFNKEQDRNARPEPPRIQPQPEPQAAVAPPMPPTPIVASATPATSMRPALSPASASGAYLDNGSKISGKLSFDTPIKIDGQVDGEIIAKDSLTIGESAVVTAQSRPRQSS